MLIQVVAEQLHGKVYKRVDGKYFENRKDLEDWLIGAKEWADRFIIFGCKQHLDYYYEANVENKRICTWIKKRVKNGIDLYA